MCVWIKMVLMDVVVFLSLCSHKARFNFLKVCPADTQCTPE